MRALGRLRRRAPPPTLAAPQPWSLQAQLRRRLLLLGAVWLLARVAGLVDSERAFAANTAHELRTPLAGARAQARRLVHGSTDPRTREQAQALLRQLDRLTGLATRLLQLARVESGVALQRAPVDLVQPAVLVVDEFTEASRSGQLQLQVRGASGPVSGDVDALGIALRNLIDNALGRCHLRQTHHRLHRWLRCAHHLRRRHRPRLHAVGAVRHQRRALLARRQPGLEGHLLRPLRRQHLRRAGQDHLPLDRRYRWRYAGPAGGGRAGSELRLHTTPAPTATTGGRTATAPAGAGAGAGRDPGAAGGGRSARQCLLGEDGEDHGGRERRPG